MQTSESKYVPNISKNQLNPGAIRELYETGAKAVCLCEDERVHELWNRIVLNKQENSNESNNWKEFWNNSVYTFAKNYYKNKTDYGDLYWFEAETFGYISRKQVTYLDTKSNTMKVWPEKIYNNNNQLASLSQETLRMAWDLSMEILTSSYPKIKLNPEDYVIHIELLKYPHSYNELQRLIDIFNNGTTWKRIGAKLNHARIQTKGILANRFIRDIYAWLTLLPFLKKFLTMFNERLGDKNFYRLEKNYTPVGQAHVDGCRFLTLLASDREKMKTEAYVNGTWIELPMSTDKFIIFPGAFYDAQNKVEPTIHRYSILNSNPYECSKKLNLTFCIGISTKKMFEERRPQ